MKTSHGIKRRSISQICPLPINEKNIDDPFPKNEKSCPEEFPKPLSLAKSENKKGIYVLIVRLK